MESTVLRILAVEDNPADLKILSEYLREDPAFDFKLAQAGTMREAIELLSTETFSIVLLDLFLPDSNGLEGLEKISKIKTLPPIIVMTGLDNEETGLQAVARNAQDFLVKGKINSDILIRSIRYAIERHKVDESVRQLNEELRITNENLMASRKSALNLMEDAIEARKEALKEKSRLEAVMESLPVGVAILDEQGGRISSNHMFEEIWGGQPPGAGSVSDYAKYKAWWTDSANPVAPLEWASAIAVHEGKTVIGQTMRIMRFDGTYAYILNSAAPIFDAEGRITGCAVAIQDITHRFEAEKALEQSTKRFEFLALTAGELLQSPEPQKLIESLCLRTLEYLDCQAFFNFLVDERAGRLRLNACAGIPEEEVRRIEWLDYGTAVCGCVARDRSRIVAEHIPSTPDERTELVKSYGIKAYACHPLHGEGNRILGTLSFGAKTRETFCDDDLAMMKAVTNQVAMALIRMQNEQALRNSEARYRSLTELSPNAIFVNRNGLIEMPNPAALRLFGADDPGQLIGRTPFDVFHPDFHEIIRGRIENLRQGRPVLPVEQRIVRFDGIERDVEVMAAQFMDAEGPAIQVVLRDVTERKQADQARIKAEKLLTRELQVNSALAGLSVTLISTDMTIKEINERVLDTAMRLTESQHGYAAVVEKDTKNLVSVALSPRMGIDCRVSAADRERVFKVDSTGAYGGLWGHALNTRKPFFENNPGNHPSAEGLPAGHLPINNFLSVPVMMGAELVGQIAVANAPRKFTDNDLDTVLRVAYLYALAIQRVTYEIALEEMNRSLEQRVEERSKDLIRINEQLLKEIEVRKKAEMRLREGEEMSRALINTPTEPVLLISVEGTIIDANEELIKRTGLTKSALIGSSMYEVVHPDFSALRRQKIADVLETEKAARFEEHSGENWFDTIIYPVRDHSGVISKLAVFSHDITDTRRMQKHIMEISELERQRIGRDIHDSLGQKLTGIGFLAEALKQTMQVKSYPELADIEEIIFNVTDSIDHARKISSGLWTERFGSYNAFQALEELAVDMRNLFRIECIFHYNVAFSIQNSTVVSNLYNIAKESINNAIKHGKSDCIMLEMYEDAEKINLKITDNGKGAMEGFEGKKGLGLNIIRYRAGIIGGTAQFKTGAGGFEVLITVKKEILENYFN